MCLGHFVVLHVRVHIPCSGVNSPGCRYVRATDLNKRAAVEAALLGHNLATRERKASAIVAVVLERIGGAEGDRTPDLMTASHALSQLSYGPKSELSMRSGRVA